MKIAQASENGVLFEQFSLLPLWEAVLDSTISIQNDQIEVKDKEEEGQIFHVFEQEFGRLLSPWNVKQLPCGLIKITMELKLLKRH